MVDRTGIPLAGRVSAANVNDVTMLLASKQLELRDAPKGYSIGEPQKAANRRLEMEIRDLTGHMDSITAGAGLTVVQKFVRGYSQGKPEQSANKPKDRGIDVEK